MEKNTRKLFTLLIVLFFKVNDRPYAASPRLILFGLQPRFIQKLTVKFIFFQVCSASVLFFHLYFYHIMDYLNLILDI